MIEINRLFFSNRSSFQCASLEFDYNLHIYALIKIYFILFFRRSTAGARPQIVSTFSLMTRESTSSAVLCARKDTAFAAGLSTMTGYHARNTRSSRLKMRMTKNSSSLFWVRNSSNAQSVSSGSKKIRGAIT